MDEEVSMAPLQLVLFGLLFVHCSLTAAILADVFPNGAGYIMDRVPNAYQGPPVRVYLHQLSSGKYIYAAALANGLFLPHSTLERRTRC